jgi:hypothetical protein
MRVEHVDVERQVRRAIADASTHPAPVLLPRPGAQLVAGDDLEAPVAWLVEVGRGVQRAAHAGQERAPGIDQPLLERAPERRPVEVALAVVGVPRVGMRVEQDDPDRAVLASVGAELAEHDRVVAAEHDRHRARRRRWAPALGDLPAVRSAFPGVMSRSPASMTDRLAKTSTSSAGCHGRRS